MRDNALTYDHIFERVRNTLINCQGFPANLVTADASIDSLGGDSLDHVELAILLEEEFNIEIPDIMFEATTPISEIAKSIEGIINK